MGHFTDLYLNGVGAEESSFGRIVLNVQVPSIRHFHPKKHFSNSLQSMMASIHPSNVGFGGGRAGWMTEEALELRVCEQERGMDEGDGKREENDGSLFRPTSTTVELVELVELLVVVVGWDGMGQLCRSRRRQRTSNTVKWN
ncbi:hypothetical protein BLNAU_18269 [Blattamonas nauphoetae]|uniref:Uncharacterized protein n=1 Tax=Blattamonas nauphoetae TaxID=2049346 RepID=A0ABQ9X972_9EUKA|nr:hypothetical protein BLNAU_18269 [Blattamonas nauphoetae]